MNPIEFIDQCIDYPWAQEVIGEIFREHPDQITAVMILEMSQLNDHPWLKEMVRHEIEVLEEKNPAGILRMVINNTERKDYPLTTLFPGIEDRVVNALLQKDPVSLVTLIVQEHERNPELRGRPWFNGAMKELVNNFVSARILMTVGVGRNSELAAQYITTIIEKHSMLFFEFYEKLEEDGWKDEIAKIPSSIAQNQPEQLIFNFEKLIKRQDAPRLFRTAALQKPVLAMAMFANFHRRKEFPWFEEIIKDACMAAAESDPEGMFSVPGAFQGMKWEKAAVAKAGENLVRTNPKKAHELLMSYQQWAQELMKKLQPIPKTETPKIQK